MFKVKLNLSDREFEQTHGCSVKSLKRISFCKKRQIKHGYLQKVEE